jgi:hypothetical protein
MSYQDDYKKYRGKCKEMCEALIQENPELSMVRGWYYEPEWDRKEPHWWCVDAEGNIHDPSVKQYPSQGAGEYTPFGGFFECAECAKSIPEAEVIQMGNYPCCSDKCAMRLVGLV